MARYTVILEVSETVEAADLYEAHDRAAALQGSIGTEHPETTVYIESIESEAFKRDHEEAHDG